MAILYWNDIAHVIYTVVITSNASNFKPLFFNNCILFYLIPLLNLLLISLFYSLRFSYVAYKTFWTWDWFSATSEVLSRDTHFLNIAVLLEVKVLKKVRAGLVSLWLLNNQKEDFIQPGVLQAFVDLKFFRNSTGWDRSFYYIHLGNRIFLT